MAAVTNVTIKGFYRLGIKAINLYDCLKNNFQFYWTGGEASFIVVPYKDLRPLVARKVVLSGPKSVVPIAVS